MRSKIVEGWMTAAEGEVTVFLIGMRINSFVRVRGWWPVFRAMPAMLRELAADRAHRPAWAAFNRRLRAGRGGVGFWHETYVIPVGRRGDRAEQRLSLRA